MNVTLSVCNVMNNTMRKWSTGDWATIPCQGLIWGWVWVLTHSKFNFLICGHILMSTTPVNPSSKYLGPPIHLMHVHVHFLALLYITAHFGKARKQAALMPKFANSYPVLNLHVQIQDVYTSRFRKKLDCHIIPIKSVPS